MRKFFLFFPFVAFSILSVVLYVQIGKDANYMPSALIGQTVPEFTLVSLTDDELVSNKDLPNQPYLINFWGTWCAACHVEHPYLVQLARSGVVIVGVDYKDKKSLAEQWLNKKGDPYRYVLMDELGHFGVDMGITGAPETFVVDSQGVVVYRHQGEINAQNWPVIEGYLQ
ncbi:DsbE family thiol:disulfide interchange protein [Marinomonas algarum]|uniref:DsbE family thiol:disulfide interchange protein n=1 Tax=Marinomonas algarum TaxID=2883105 RepID=A0A9X1LCG0_9GAMM|nr:DsbE family thiol:disulfide interchange protein [Marinomonas algarum]MCB5161999.1 DsbE family thiol:disulfide interchange protein [Marinomonas algarum]